jgi:hypothetical protein
MRKRMKTTRKQRFTPIKDLVKVIKRMQDGTLDYYITRTRAKQLMQEGKLFFELTNHCYMQVSEYDNFSEKTQ